MIRVVALLFLLIAGVAWGPAMAVEGSPFAARTAAPAEEPGISLPPALSGLLLQVAEMQRRLNARLGGDVRSFAEEGSPVAALAIVGVAFLYGVFHAAGPGHGKLVVTSYFLSRHAPVRRGIAMSAMIAAVQAATAILLVGVFAVALKASRFEVLGHALTVEMVSYLLLIAMGLYLVWRAAVGKECCDHAADSHHHAGHDHGHDHGEAHHAASAGGWRGRLAGTVGEMPVIAVAVGLRPCSGGIVVLLFALSHGVFWIGAVAVAAMALGVAITTSLIGLGAIGLRRGVVGLTAGRPTAYAATMRGIALAGAVAITGSGTLLFLAALQRGALL